MWNKNDEKEPTLLWPEGSFEDGFYDWYCGRVGDHLPDPHYTRLRLELIEMLNEQFVARLEGD